MSADSSPGTRTHAAAEPDALDDIVRYGDIELNTRTRVARRGERSLRLNQTSLLLLAFFIGRPEIAHSRSQIATALWGDSTCDERTIDVYVRRLRGVLTRGREPDPLRTVRGVGYALSYQNADRTGRVRKVSLSPASGRQSDGMGSVRLRAPAEVRRSVKSRVAE